MFRYLVSILLTFSIASQGLALGLSCNKSQSYKIEFSLIQKAQLLDQVNEKFNNTLFKDSVVRSLLKGTGNAEGLSWIRTARQFSRLKKYLESLPNTGETVKRSELIDIIEKASKIDFLFEDSIYKNLSLTDKIKYRDLRDAMLFHGIKSVFEINLKNPGPISNFFKKIGNVLSPGEIHSTEDLAMKAAWEGFGNSRGMIDQELQYKFGITKPVKDYVVRNFIRTIFAYLILAELILPMYDHGKMIQEKYREGTAEAMVAARGVESGAESISNKQYIQSSTAEMRFQSWVESFTAREGREPVGLEVEWLRALASKDKEKAAELLALIVQDKKLEYRLKVLREGPDRGAFGSPSTDLNKTSPTKMTVEEFPNTALEPDQPEDR